MKKTLFLTHILAAVVACSGISHAQEVNELVELKGNQTKGVSDGDSFPLYVTGPNNTLQGSPPAAWERVNFFFMAPTKIVNGELKINSVTMIPKEGNVKWEMAANSKLGLGGSTAELGYFSITGETVVIDDGKLILKDGQEYSLGGNLRGTASVTMNSGSKLNLNGKTLSCKLVTSGDAFIGNGTLNNEATTAAGMTLTLNGDLKGTGTISLGDKATLALNGKTLSNNVSTGDVTIGNGTYNGSLSVGDGKTLTLSGDLGGPGKIALGDNATLNLAGKKLAGTVSMNGSGTISGGTINGDLYAKDFRSLSLSGDLGGTGSVFLGDQVTLYMNGKTLSKGVVVTFDARMGNGTHNGDLTVEASRRLTLNGDLKGTGTVTMGDKASLNLDGKTLSKNISMSGDANIGNGTHNGDLEVKAGKTLTLNGDLKGTGTVTMGEKAALALDGKTLTKGVSLAGDATMGNGTYNGDLAVKDGKTLTLGGDLGGTGTITMGDKTTLALANNNLTKNVSIAGNATIGNGTYNGSLSVGAGKALTLNGTLGGQGVVNLADRAALNLGGHTISTNINLVQNSSIGGSGTMQGNLILADGVSYTWTNREVQLAGGAILGANSLFDLGGYTINAATLTADSSILANGTVSGNFILGDGVSYTWGSRNDLRITGNVTLGDKSQLDLTGDTINTATLDAGSAVIDNGTISGNLTLASGVTYTWGTGNNLHVTGTVTLEDLATLNLNGKILTQNIIVATSATLAGGGTLDCNAEVKGGTGRLALQDVTLGDSATISMGDGAQLDLCRAEAALGKLRFTGQSAVVDNGTLIVAGGETLTLCGNLSGTATVSLGDKASLDLGGKTLSNGVTLAGDATLGNGTCSGSLEVQAGKTLTLCGDLSGAGEITLKDTAGLNLNGRILGKAVILEGSATLGGGTYSGFVNMGAGQTLTLCGDLSGTGVVNLEDGSALDLGGYRLGNNVTLNGSAKLAGGTIGGDLSLADNVSYTWSDNSLQLTGGVTLGANSKFDLSGRTITAATLTANDSILTNGTVSGNFTVTSGLTYTWGAGNSLILTGTVTLGDNVTLNLGGATLATNFTLTGRATIDYGTMGGGKSVITGGSIIKTGAGRLDMEGKVNLRQLDVRQGDVTITGTEDAQGSIASLLVAAGSTIELVHTNVTGDSGDKAYQCNLVIGEGSTVTAGIDDGWAYRSNNYLTVKDGGKLDLGVHRWTLTPVNKITLAGGEIACMGGIADFSGGTNVVAVTEDSTFSASVRVRAQENTSLAFDVAEDAELAFSGNIVSLGEFDDDKATIYKRGKGTVVMSGANALTDGTIIVQAGTLKAAGGANPLGSGTVKVMGGATLALDGDFSGGATVNLGSNATLNLGGHTLDHNVILEGAAAIENGTLGGDLTLAEGISYTWSRNDLVIAGNVILGNKSRLNLNGKTLNTATLTAGTAGIDNGTVSGNLTLAAGVSYTWGGCNDLLISGTVTLEDGASLNLGGNTVTQHIIVDEDATLAGEGTFNGNALVKAGTGRLALHGSTLGSGATVSLEDGAQLDLCGTEAGLGKLRFAGRSAVVDNGTLTVAGGEVLTLGGDLTGTGTVALGDKAVLNLGGKSLSNAVTLAGDAAIGNGEYNGDLEVNRAKALSLCGDLTGTGEVLLHAGAELHLDGNAITKDIILDGSATIRGDGSQNGTIAVGTNSSLTLDGDLSGTGSIILGSGSLLNIGYNTLSKDVLMTADNASISGTLQGNLVLESGVSLTWTRDDLLLTGGVVLEANSRFDLNGKEVNNVTLNANDSTITNGTVTGNLILADGVSDIWTDDTLQLTGGVTLGADSRFNLNGKSVKTATLTAGSSVLSNGTVTENLTLAGRASHTLGGSDLQVTGTVTLGEGGRLDMNGKTLENRVAVEGSATLDNGTLSVTNGKTLALGGNLQGTAGIAIDDGTVKLGDHAWSMTQASPQGAKVLYTVQGKGDSSVIGGHGRADATGLAGAGETSRAQVQGVRLTTQANFSISDTDICDSLIDIGKGTTMTLKNVNIKAGTRFTDDTASMVMVNTRAELKQDDNTLVTGAETLFTATELLLCGNNAQSVTLTAGNRGVNLTCSMFDSITMDGGDLWLDMTDIAGSGTLKDWNFFTLTFDNLDLANEVEKARVNVENMSVSVTLDGSSYATEAYYNSDELEGGYAPRLFFVLPAASDVLVVNSSDPITDAIIGSVTIVKQGKDAASVIGDTSEFTGSVEVQEGALNIMNNADLNTVQDVTIATDATLGVYQDETADEANEGTLTIQEDKVLTVGEGATLNANLVMKAGSKLDVSAAQGGHGLIMGSEVTLESGALLSNASLEAPVDDFNAFLFDYLSSNEYYYLYDSVEDLYIQQGDEVKPFKELDFVNARNMDMDASRVFTNLDENTYALVYNWDPIHENVVALRMMPEPTTSTLSLLALCALAARRRRRH